MGVNAVQLAHNMAFSTIFIMYQNYVAVGSFSEMQQWKLGFFNGLQHTKIISVPTVMIPAIFSEVITTRPKSADYYHFPKRQSRSVLILMSKFFFFSG